MRWLVVLALLTCGCDSPAKRIDKHRAKAMPVLEQLKALGPIIAKQAPVTTAQWDLPAGVTLADQARVYDGKGGSSLNPAYNLGITFVEYIDKLCDAGFRLWVPDYPASGPLTFLIEHGEEWLLDPACYLVKGKPWYVTDWPPTDLVEERLQQFEATKFVAAIRIRDIETAGLVMEEIEAKQIEHFKQGRIQGDVLVYELATQKLVGAYPIDASLPESVEVRGTGEHDQLNSMLTERADSAIKYGLKDHATLSQ
jgi:hypothetical protein